MATSKIDTDIAFRIGILRYTMIFGIVVLHVPPYVSLLETGPTFFDFFKALLQHAVFRSSVPVLTFISGYLLFSSSMDLKFRALLKKKTKTILIPLFVFNFPLVLLLYFIQSSHYIDYDFSRTVYPFNMLVWLDATVGLNGGVVNYPLAFLRDLYIISVCAPLFGFLVRRYPWFGFAIVFVFFWFNFDGGFVIRNTMPIVFYVGGMAAVYQWNLKALDKYAIAMLLVFLVLCAAIVVFEVQNRNYLRIISPILIWPAASLLIGTRLGGWINGISKYSFFTFLMQGPVLLALWMFYGKALPSIPYWMFWVSAPIITAVTLAYVNNVLQHFFPRLMKFSLGGR